MTKGKVSIITACYFILSFVLLGISDLKYLNADVNQPRFPSGEYSTLFFVDSIKNEKVQFAFSSPQSLPLESNKNPLSGTRTYLRASKFIVQSIILSPALIVWYPLRTGCLFKGCDLGISLILEVPALIIGTLILYLLYSHAFYFLGRSFFERKKDPAAYGVYRGYLLSLFMVWLVFVSFGIWYAKKAYVDPHLAYSKFVTQLEKTAGNKDPLPIAYQDLWFLRIDQYKNSEISVGTRVGDPYSGVNLKFSETARFSKQQTDKICERTLVDNLLDGYGQPQIKELGEIAPNVWACYNLYLTYPEGKFNDPPQQNEEIFYVGFLDNEQKIFAYTKPVIYNIIVSGTTPPKPPVVLPEFFAYYR